MGHNTKHIHTDLRLHKLRQKEQRSTQMNRLAPLKQLWKTDQNQIRVVDRLTKTQLRKKNVRQSITRATLRRRKERSDVEARKKWAIATSKQQNQSANAQHQTHRDISSNNSARSRSIKCTAIQNKTLWRAALEHTHTVKH